MIQRMHLLIIVIGAAYKEKIQQAMVDRQPLFAARTAGYHNCRIPGIVVTPAGTLLAYCEARKGKGGDHDTIDILMRRSTDGGNLIAFHRVKAFRALVY